MLKITCFTSNKDKVILENVLLLIEPAGPGAGEKRIAIFREFDSNGDAHCKSWPILNQEEYDNCVSMAKDKNFNESFTVTSSDSENADVINSIFQHTFLPSLFHRVAPVSIEADYWSAARLRTSRPQSYGETIDVFTFEALKEMWKSIGKNGFSSKSKSDLYEGFAESASDLATGPESEFTNKLPSRMVLLTNRYHSSHVKVESVLRSAAQALTLTSRISGKVLYNKESSPEITNDTIRLKHLLVDLADPYKEPIENEFTTEQEALEALKPVSTKRAS